MKTFKGNPKITIEYLKNKCANCKYYYPVIKDYCGIMTAFNRGMCLYEDRMTLKQRTDTCKNFLEGNNVLKEVEK